MNHYERLGIAPTATPAEVRAAYRRTARAVHPDRHGDRSSSAMAAVNEAHRVLGDPVRRAAYDEQLALGAPPRGSGSGSTAPASGAASGAPRAEDEAWAVAVAPSRFPWRLLLTMGALAIGVIVLGVIFTDAPPEQQIDNVLRPGDCVLLGVDLDAAETRCDLPHDAVLQVLIPLDQTCPVGTEAFRDRQGMGTACVVRSG